MDSEKTKTIERIRKFKESKLINKIVLTGALVGATFGSAKANGSAASEVVNKSDTIKNKIEVKTSTKSAIDSINDSKTYKADFSEKADTLSVREHNEQVIKEGDPAVKLLIAMAEDFRNDTYLCAAKVRTFGYGTTNIGRPLRKTDSVSKFAEISDEMDEDQRRDAILSKGMEYVSEYLSEHVYPVILDNVNKKLTPNQVVAISSLIYNIGKGNFLGYTNKKTGKVTPQSSVLMAINGGKTDAEIAQTFLKHVYTKFGANQALAARRAGEGLIYMDGRILPSLTNSWVGACYIRKINDYFKEDVSTKAKFFQAVRQGKLTLKTDKETIDKYIEAMTLKPSEKLKDVSFILPQDTVRAVQNMYLPKFDNRPISAEPKLIPIKKSVINILKDAKIKTN